MPTRRQIKSTGPKVRCDSRLKNLPEAVQKEIVDKMRMESRETVRDWLLAEKRIKTNVASLSEFLHWWHASKRIEEASSLATQISKLLVDNPKVKLDPKLTLEAGQAIFSAMAVANHDAELFVDLAYVHQGDQRTKIAEERTQIAAERNKLTQAALKLEREKFEFVAVKAMLAHVEVLREIKGRTDLSEDEQIRLAREKVFGQLPKTMEAA